MSRARCIAALAAVMMVLTMAVPPVALAAGTWPWPVEGPVVLSYGQNWVDTRGGDCAHGGLDLRAPEGARVAACASGEVAFAGLVPAGAGKRAYAVTVLTADGLRVTYLPLESVSVHRGDQVPAGAAIGRLAASGDGSYAEPHLHLGVKRGDAALDPAAFLGPRGGVVAPVTPAVPKTAPKTGAASAPAASRSASAHTPSPARQAAGMSAASAAPAGADALAHAAAGAASALAALEPLEKIAPVAAPATLDLARAGADLSASRASVLALALRVGLAVLAGACVLPVFRAARTAGATGARPVPIAVRRDRA